VTYKGNEVKPKMKHPLLALDMPTPRFELGGSDMWLNALPTRPNSQLTKILLAVKVTIY